jgi:hypothetical protein
VFAITKEGLGGRVLVEIIGESASGKRLYVKPLSQRTSMIKAAHTSKPWVEAADVELRGEKVDQETLATVRKLDAERAAAARSLRERHRIEQKALEAEHLGKLLALASRLDIDIQE